MLYLEEKEYDTKRNDFIKNHRYTFTTSGLTKKQFKQLSYSKDQREWNDELLALPGSLATFTGMIAPIGILCGLLADHSFGEVALGSASALATALLLTPQGTRIKRALQFRRLSGIVHNRMHTIVIQDGIAKNSYAFNVLLNTAFGRTVLRHELFSASVTSSWDLKEYLWYIVKNPDNKLFPKLKREFDEFLERTAKHDEVIAKFEKVASDSEIKRLKTEVDLFAAETAQRMQVITDEHNAPIETRRHMAIEEDRRVADMEVREVPSLTVYKELPQPL